MVLSTDGTLSYASFIYENETSLAEILGSQSLVRGFSAGDGERFTNIEFLDGNSVIYQVNGRFKVY